MFVRSMLSKVLRYSDQDCVLTCYKVLVFDSDSVPYHFWTDVDLGTVFDLVDTFSDRLWSMQVSKPSLVQGLVENCKQEANGGWRIQESTVETSSKLHLGTRDLDVF